MRNEIVEWSEQEQAEARQAAQELEWENSGLKLPNPRRADSLPPYTLVYTMDEMADALLKLYRQYQPSFSEFDDPEYQG